MDPSISADHLWNALVEGGDASQKAVASFTALPEGQKDTAFEQLLRRTEGYILTLIAEETAGNRHIFRESKAKFLRVLDAIPSLANTDALKETAQKRIAEIDKQSEPLTNIDIVMKCDEIADKLNPLTLSDLTGPKVIECTSLEELKQQLSELVPPEVAAHIISEIGDSDDAIITGSISLSKNTKKKNPPPANN